MIWEGLVVEIIRIFWDHGLYRDNPWFQKIHTTWFHHWVEYKTKQTMQDVDKQIEELNPEPVEISKPIYWEEEKGDTPLGGAMGLRHEFTDDNNA